MCGRRMRRKKRTIYDNDRMCVGKLELSGSYRIEHDDVEIVAANDPFIDPEYAVSCLQTQRDEAKP